MLDPSKKRKSEQYEKMLKATEVEFPSKKQKTDAEAEKENEPSDQSSPGSPQSVEILLRTPPGPQQEAEVEKEAKAEAEKEVDKEGTAKGLKLKDKLPEEKPEEEKPRNALDFLTDLYKDDSSKVKMLEREAEPQDEQSGEEPIKKEHGESSRHPEGPKEFEWSDNTGDYEYDDFEKDLYCEELIYESCKIMEGGETQRLFTLVGKWRRIKPRIQEDKPLLKFRRLYPIRCTEAYHTNVRGAANTHTLDHPDTHT